MPRAHWGLPTDSASRLVLIALSRLLRTQDEMMLTQAAGSPVGSAFLASLRAAVLRVAVVAGGADTSLNETSVETLFNLSGSSFDRQARYDGASLTLPSRLPWPKAKALVRVMLDSIAASLVVAEGSLLHRMLLQLPFVPLDEQAQAAVAKLIAVVESEMSSRLQRGGGADASSSSSSTWSAQPPQPPQPLALPMPFAPQPQPQFSSQLSAETVAKTPKGRAERAAPGVFHGSRPGPRCAAPGASRARARPHMWGSR